MNSLSPTFPISSVSGFLSGADRSTVVRLAEQSGISQDLLQNADARVSQEQFSTLYRLLADELDDEMPGIFSRQLRKGTLKFLCLSLLEAPRLEVALHRFGQFFHLILDDFTINSYRKGEWACVELIESTEGPGVSMLGCELMLKLIHGVASWLIRQKISLAEIAFQGSSPPEVNDCHHLFPGPVRYRQSATRICFDETYLDMPIRQRKTDLTEFLCRAPEDWIFVPSADHLICHRVRQCIAECLPAAPTIEYVARRLHHSVRTLCRRLEEKGTTFQAIKDDVRRDMAIQRLTRSDDAIAAIAYDIGFDHTTAFYRAFRNWTGSTPTAYRNTA